MSLGNEKYIKIWENFLNPPEEFSAVPMWFINDNLEHAAIIRQINEFHKQEIYGFVLHPRMGLPRSLAYMSDEFLDYVETAVSEAEKLRMKVILYDEGMYPSGSAHGQVVAANRNFAAQVLTKRYSASSEIELNPGEILVSIQKASPELGHDGWVAFIQKESGGKIRGIHYGEDSRDAMAPLSADILNPEAVKCFISMTHDKYYQRLKQYFGKTVIAFFTDEPSLTGRGDMTGKIPWTFDFLQVCRNNGVREDDLELLFADGIETGKEARQIFQEVCLDRLNDTYYKQLGSWCFEHGIALTGHPAQSNEIGLLKYMQLPGQDLVLRKVAPEDGKALKGDDSTLAKGVSSHALVNSLTRNAVESFGCCTGEDPGSSWYLPAADLKWYVDWLAVRGVNLYIPHAFYYSLRDDRKWERPPDVGPAQTWWQEYHHFSRYMRRMSWLQSGETLLTNVAILCRKAFLPWRTAEILYKNQIDFIYLEEKYLPEIALENSFARIGKAEIRTILVEEPFVASARTKILLDKLRESGIDIIYVSPEKQKSIPQWLIAARNATPLKNNSYTPDLRVSWIGREWWSHLLLVNEGEKPISTEIDCRTENIPVQWDPWLGRSGCQLWQRPERGTLRLQISIAGRQSQVISMFPAQILSSRTKPDDNLFSKTIAGIYDFTQDWKISFIPIAQEFRKRVLPDWQDLLGQVPYSGYAIYEKTFSISLEKRQVKYILTLGEVHEVAKVLINDSESAVFIAPPYETDITAQLRDGLNTVKIYVYNNVSCQMERIWRRSGLFGPVKIKIEECK